MVNKRSVVYGSILSMAAGGLLYSHLNRRSSRLSLDTNCMNLTDMITSELPLTASTFAAGDAIHHLMYLNHLQSHQQTLTDNEMNNIYMNIAVSSTLGFVYPYLYLKYIQKYINQSLKINISNNQKNENTIIIRPEFKHFCRHALIAGLILSIPRLPKYVAAGAVSLVCCCYALPVFVMLLPQHIADDNMDSFNDLTSTLFSPAKVVFDHVGYFENKLIDYLKPKLCALNLGPFNFLKDIDVDRLLDVKFESSFTFATIYQLFIHTSFSRYYKPISYWKRQNLMELEDKKFYQQLLPYLTNDGRINLPDDILLEIFEYCGTEIEIGFKSYVDYTISKPEICMVQYERKQPLIYSLKVMSSILFSLWSYKQLFY